MFGWKRRVGDCRDSALFIKFNGELYELFLPRLSVVVELHHSVVTFSGGQGSTASQIILHTVVIPVGAAIGPNSITVTVKAGDGTNQTSNNGSFTLDGPFYMIVQNDIITTCSGCITTVARQTTYQVTNFSTVNSGAVKIGEPAASQVESNWNCNQAAPSGSAVCSLGYATNSVGVFMDQWSLLSDGFTPVGCGWNINDYWTWCPTGKSIGHLSGYLHNNSVNINGSIMPPQSNRMPTNLVINP